MGQARFLFDSSLADRGLDRAQLITRVLAVPVLIRSTASAVLVPNRSSMVLAVPVLIRSTVSAGPAPIRSPSAQSRLHAW
jgi:hypothetical protein